MCDALVDHAYQKGWCRTREEFHFACCYSDLIYTRLDGCCARQKRSTELLQEKAGQVTAETMMAALRDHGATAADPLWNPGRGWLMDKLCVHASLGPTCPSESVGSLIAHPSADLPTFWVAGTAGPCTNVFKPVYLGGAGLPPLGPDPTGSYDSRSLWWAHERLHRATLRDYPTRMPSCRQERDALERAFCSQAAGPYQQLRLPSASKRTGRLAEYCAACLEQAAQATTGWAGALAATPIRHRPPLPFSIAWKILDRQAGYPEED